MAEKIREARAQSRRWKIGAAAGTLIGTALVVGMLFAISAAASGQAACAVNNHLVGSSFEIDTDANLKVNSADCIDWLTGGTGTALRSDVVSKPDKPTGSGDDSFGQGTSEDSANPTIVDGSIPPNKSDLKRFGVKTESGTSGKFLELFWSRVQNPSGTTNMDFELNQNFCDLTATPTNCADNGKNFPSETPVRTIGDKLITYDLSKGGTVPTIGIRTWSGSAWGAPTVISGGGSGVCTSTTPTNCAVGAVNSSPIGANDAGAVGAQDAFTFGEAAISYLALFPSGTTGCGKFGSAYLKSRSSDSFSAELKDFIGPENVNITNCTSITTTAVTPVTIGSPISDSATLTGAGTGAGGTITFHLFSTSNCAPASEINTGLTPVSVNGSATYGSGNYTPTTVGTYYWTASYSGDPNNAAQSTACGENNEASVVNQAHPSLSTTPSPTSGTVGDTLNDTASLSSGQSPTGSITFKLWGPANTTCDATVAAPVFSQSVTVNGNGSSYGTTGGYATTAAGTYRWTASYGGDTNNASASSGCSAEAVVVGPASPTLVTSPSAGGAVGTVLNDSATLSLGYSPTGTITFKLWGPSNPTCDANVAAAVFTQGVTVSSGNGSYSTTTGYTTTGPGTFRWTASYGGDGNNNTAASGCTEEAVTILLLDSTITTAQRWYPQDTATIGGGGGGTVIFNLYKSGTCGGTAVYGPDSASVDGTTHQASTSNANFSVSSVAALGDTYSWRAAYSGDTTHKAVTSCVEATAFSSLANGGTITSP